MLINKFSKNRAESLLINGTARIGQKTCQLLEQQICSGNLPMNATAEMAQETC